MDFQQFLYEFERMKQQLQTELNRREDAYQKQLRDLNAKIAKLRVEVVTLRAHVAMFSRNKGPMV